MKFSVLGDCSNKPLGGECSIQLSYDDTCRKPLILLGFWDFSLRPYIRLSTLFRVVNLQIFFDLVTLERSPIWGMPRLSLRRQTLYPTELQKQEL